MNFKEILASILAIFGIFLDSPTPIINGGNQSLLELNTTIQVKNLNNTPTELFVLSPETDLGDNPDVFAKNNKTLTITKPYSGILKGRSMDAAKLDTNIADLNDEMEGMNKSKTIITPYKYYANGTQIFSNVSDKVPKAVEELMVKINKVKVENKRYNQSTVELRPGTSHVDSDLAGTMYGFQGMEKSIVKNKLIMFDHKLSTALNKKISSIANPKYRNTEYSREFIIQTKNVNPFLGSMKDDENYENLILFVKNIMYPVICHRPRMEDILYTACRDLCVGYLNEKPRPELQRIYNKIHLEIIRNMPFPD